MGTHQERYIHNHNIVEMPFNFVRMVSINSVNQCRLITAGYHRINIASNNQNPTPAD